MMDFIPRFAGVFLFLHTFLVVLSLFAGRVFPDETLVFAAGHYFLTDIHILDLDHRLEYNLTPTRGNDNYPKWSPDGRYIASINRDYNAWMLQVIEVATGDTRQLTPAGMDSFSPSWISGGDGLVFMGRYGGEWSLYRVNLDGSNLERISHRPGKSRWPSWKP